MKTIGKLLWESSNSIQVLLFFVGTLVLIDLMSEDDLAFALTAIPLGLIYLLTSIRNWVEHQFIRAIAITVWGLLLFVYGVWQLLILWPTLFDVPARYPF